MKNMKSIKQLLTIVLAGLLPFSCTTDDKVVDEVVATTTRGAILRTLDEDGSFDMFRTQNSLQITLEEQDLELGALLDRVDLTMSFVDNNFADEDNETDRESVLNVDFGSIPASAFTTGDAGLPVTDYSYTMEEALTATGVNLTQVLPGDQFVLDLELILTDGRTFTASAASGNVSGGSFFSSPFQYTLAVDDGVDFAIENVRAEGITIADATGININSSAVNNDYDIVISINDAEEGAQLQTLNIYREFIDRTVDEGDPDLSEAEALIESVDISTLPLVLVTLSGGEEINIRTFAWTYTLAELYGATLTFGDLSPNDEFNIRYELVAADGRVITTNEDETEYYVQIGVLDCNLLNATTPVDGDYTIKFFDSFGDGWDGAEITVEIDGGAAEAYTILGGDSGEAVFNVPEGTTSLVVSYVPGNWEEEHSYQIIAPNGFLAAEDGPEPREGPIPLAVCGE